MATKKKSKTKTRKASKPAKPQLIGKVSHYYDKIGVAVVKLSAPLKQGDSITIEGGDRSFSQTVDSMESDHQKITVAKKGSEIGIKVNKKAREGYRVHKV